MIDIINVAVAGVGNCASALVQGLEYYKEKKGDIPGLMHAKIGKYSIGDIKIVCALDIDKRKVGRDLSEAIFSGSNCTVKFCDVPKQGVEVLKAPVKDGVGRYTENSFLVDETQKPQDISEVLKKSGAEILINYLPVGSEEASRFYATMALDANLAFINAIPVFIASDEVWRRKFKDKGLPLIGDDVKGQIGATILHRNILKLLSDRGVCVDRTYQLNFGGNTDFQNMLERDRLKSKKISKTESAQSQLDKPLSENDIHIGPSDYVPWLDDKKIAHIRVEGRKFGDIPFNMDLKLEVIDSPNSAGVMVDAIRLAKLALDRGIGGILTSASAYLMKKPPEQFFDGLARDMVEGFIRGEQER